MANIQRSSEIVIYQGQTKTFNLVPKDASGSDITINDTPSKLSELAFNAYKYIDDTTATVTVSSVTHTDGASTIQVNFVPSETSSTDPQTYMYVLTGKYDGEAKIFLRDQLSVLRV